ncbi:MAG: DUF2868 domain-containing protein [Deltaproteobacteria bacterium]|nr:DUF2868 domain-containing protein [Deltaproteobacteria bacterium]
MTEDESRIVLLVRAVDEGDDVFLASETNAAAWHAGGAIADREAFALRRATFIVERLPEAIRRLLHFDIPPRESALVLFAAAAGLGLASNALSLDRRIHVLANPVAALVLWNLVVYAGMSVVHVRRQSVRTGRPAGTHAPLRSLLALVTRSSLAWARLRGRSSVATPAMLAAARLRVRYATAYASVCADPILARCEALAHGAAIAFALGALVGIFVQGVAFEYRVEWGSTLVASPGARATIAAAIFLPARLLLGAGFPDAEQLALASAPGGAPAAVWFHVFAITVACIVLAPRTALLMAARLRARRLARQIVLPAADPYWERIAASASVAPSEATATTLISSFALDADACTLLASLEVELVAADIGKTPTGRFDALGRKKRWFARWKTLVTSGFTAFPEGERPRVLDGDANALADVASRVRRSANPFAPELVLLELAAFEAYGPLDAGARSLSDRLGLAPALDRRVRATALQRASRLLGLPDHEAGELRTALTTSGREISRFYPKVVAGAAAGSAVGALTLGIAAPLAVGLVGKAVGVAGLAALKTGLTALGGHAVVGAGIGAAGGTVIVAGGGTLLAPAQTSSAAALTPAGALLSGAKIEVFLRRIVATRHRDAATFSAAVGELRLSLDRLREELPRFRLDAAHTSRQIQEREKVISILERVAQRTAQWGRQHGIA